PLGSFKEDNRVFFDKNSNLLFNSPIAFNIILESFDRVTLSGRIAGFSIDSNCNNEFFLFTPL
ncbi:hypothetical protein, partial [Bacteroides rodentium]